MSAAEDAEVVRRGYAAFSTGDLDTFRELFAPEIRWHVNGRNPQAGTSVGVDAVLGTFMRLASETSGTFRVEVHDLLATDNHVVVLARSSAERRGQRLETNYCHVFHLSGGRVTEAWIVNEDTYALDEFWTE
jgi:ketosteroid isomerase-like protein